MAENHQETADEQIRSIGHHAGHIQGRRQQVLKIRLQVQLEDDEAEE